VGCLSSFVAYAFGVVIEESTAKSEVMKIYPCVSSKSFTLLALTLKAVMILS